MVSWQHVGINLVWAGEYREWSPVICLCLLIGREIVQVIDLHHKIGKIQPLKMFTFLGMRKRKRLFIFFCLNGKCSDIIAFLYQEKWIGCFLSTNNSLLFSSEPLKWDVYFQTTQTMTGTTVLDLFDILLQNWINVKLKSYQ